ncbi:hypothetical protein ACP4OV_003678 [Aristida adscensionis]
MDAIAFPPPPAPFPDDDFDFGDFAFAPAPTPAPAPAAPRPQPAAATFADFADDWGDFVASPLGSNASASASAPPTPPTAQSTAAWEKPRGPLPLSLFGADEQEEEEKGRGEEGPAGPPPTATAHQRVPSFSSMGSRPADLKDLIAGLYGSQPPPSAAASAAAAGSPEEAEDDDDGFGDDGWEFKAAMVSPADQDGGERPHGDGTANIEDVTKTLGSDQEDWSLFTGVDEELNHVQTADLVGTIESSIHGVKPFNYSPANNAAILDLYKESNPAGATHVMQTSAESVQSSCDLFSNNEMESRSIRSTSDSFLIDFYHRLREESLAVISRHMNILKETQKSYTLSDENSKATEIGKEIQEIYEKFQGSGSSLPKGFCTDEHPSRDVCITELLNSIKEEHLKDFEHEYHLAERITRAMDDTNVAVELYKHSLSILHTLELASKEEQCDYVSAWYNMLLSCAQELQHGAAVWQESCHANVCNQVISEGAHCFLALGEIYRVAQVLYFSLQRFKPWVFADPGAWGRMLACLDTCNNAWTSGLETALKTVADSNHLDESAAKALVESIKNINELEVHEGDLMEQ